MDSPFFSSGQQIAVFIVQGSSKSQPARVLSSNFCVFKFHCFSVHFQLSSFHCLIPTVVWIKAQENCTALSSWNCLKIYSYLESLLTEDLSDVDDIDAEDVDNMAWESQIYYFVHCSVSLIWSLNFLFHVWKCH